jgi:tetratricopeptide (TPR) repeat protein
VSLVLGITVAGLTGAARAGEAEKPAEGEKPALTPEQQEAQRILERFAQEKAVEQQMKAREAARRVKAGKENIEMGAFSDALRNFERAVELDPTNKDAQEGLSTAQTMLDLKEKKFGDLAAEYARQRAVGLQVEKTRLDNMFNKAMQLYQQERYADAVEAFTRTAGQARYLAPSIDVSQTAEQCALYTQKALQAAEEKRRREERARLEQAKEETERIRQERENLLDERTQALYRQASVLFEQHRYEECRKVCDEILLKDPTNGAAESLREAANEASRTESIDRAVKARRVETERHWQETRAMSVPQSELVYMPRDKFEEVRSRVAATAIGGELKKPERWESEIQEAMNKPISFDFVETPLQDVISFISGVVDVTIVLDTDAIRDEQLTVTLRVNEMRLESALKWVLKLVNLKYTLRNEAVFVSKAEKIYDKPVLRMYDVSDLTIDIKNFQGRQQALASDGGYSSTGSSGSGGSGSDSLGEDFFGDEDEEDEDEKLTGQSLVEFIKRTIAPDTWTDTGDDIDVF